MSTIQLHDKTFKKYLSENDILHGIEELGKHIVRDYEDKKPVFLGVLNGSFLFFADLIKHIHIECEISFIKLRSYEGTQSANDVKQVIGLSNNLKDRHTIIVEDIVDTGNTLGFIYKTLESVQVASVKTATLLYKPEAYKKTLPIDYSVFEIPNKFVVGYGLDYNDLGRNLNDIYQLDVEDIKSIP